MTYRADTKWVVAYTRMPTNHNPTERMLVEAESAAVAVELVREALGDRGPGLSNFAVGPAELHKPVEGEGRVLGYYDSDSMVVLDEGGNS